MERYPAHAVAKWLGHSPKLAAEHYLMSREHHFEDVVGGGGDLRRRRPEAPTPTPCDANCISAGVRGGKHPAARNDGTHGHHQGYRGFLGNRAGLENRPSGRYRTRTYDP